VRNARPYGDLFNPGPMKTLFSEYLPRRFKDVFPTLFLGDVPSLPVSTPCPLFLLFVHDLSPFFPKAEIWT